MSTFRSDVLPYKTDGDDLTRLIEACGRGRILKQIQGLGFSEAGFQGTVATAQALGLLDHETDELTESGREYALSHNSDRKRAVLLEAILQYEPYDLLLEAIFDQGYQEETTTQWVETWWSTQKYGNSQRNRNEGSTTFAKLIEYVGLGDFVVGRRGRPSRIEWREDVIERMREARSMLYEQDGGGLTSPVVDAPAELDGDYVLKNSKQITDVERLSPRQTVRLKGNSELTLPLSSGRIAILSLPPILTESEKERLLTLVDLMITIESEPVNSFSEEAEDF